MAKKLTPAQIDVLIAYRDDLFHNRSTRVTGALLDKGLLEPMPQSRALRISEAGKAALDANGQPSEPDAYDFVDEKGHASHKLPYGSIVRTNGTLMVVERSNGYVLSGYEVGHINRPMGIDLRNQKTSIVKLATFDTPATPEAPAPVAPDSPAESTTSADVKLLPSGNQAIALLPARINERIIALPLPPVAPIAPLALPSKVEYIGKHTYRITQHTARLISVEQLHPFVGIWQHVANYATSEQVDNFRARMIAEANRPAPREETYRMNSLYVEAYRVYGGGYVWRYKIKGASTRGFVFGSFASAEEALKAARAYVDSKAAAVRRGVLLNKGL